MTKRGRFYTEYSVGSVIDEYVGAFNLLFKQGSDNDVFFKVYDSNKRLEMREYQHDLAKLKSSRDDVLAIEGINEQCKKVAEGRARDVFSRKGTSLKDLNYAFWHRD